MSTPRSASGRVLPWLATLLALALLVGGCSRHFARGQFLEDQGRWEEAAIEYHLAVIDDPEDADFRDALQRANKVVARENMERYRGYLANKEFRKAYQRLRDASRQDPEYPPVKEELAKWMRVLVGGQVNFEFEALRTNLSLADEIDLVVRLNSPNPGQTVDAQIDIDTGTFFAEDLLYDRPNDMLAYYSLNSIGVRLVRKPGRTQQFTSTEFQRFINFRTPILDQVTGRLVTPPGGDLQQVATHRPQSDDVRWLQPPYPPQSSPHYSLHIADERIEVASAAGRSDFTPRFLYINKQDQRMFVDFGRYELVLDRQTREWRLRRLPLGDTDYFGRIARNVALQPYFYYRDGVYSYVPAGSG